MGGFRLDEEIARAMNVVTYQASFVTFPCSFALPLTPGWLNGGGGVIEGNVGQVSATLIKHVFLRISNARVKSHTHVNVNCCISTNNLRMVSRTHIANCRTTGGQSVTSRSYRKG
jgi:hypothetical protein